MNKKELQAIIDHIERMFAPVKPKPISKEQLKADIDYINSYGEQK